MGGKVMDVLKELNALGIRAKARPSIEEQKRLREVAMQQRKANDVTTSTSTDKCSPMAIEQFKVMLRNHDWTYNYTDDHRVWKRGQQQHDRIQWLCNNYPELKAVYEQHRGGRGL
jgi:hypothetical protein